MRFRELIAPAIALAALSGALTVSVRAAPPAASTPEIDQGRELFRAKGCYECHGLAAQGAMGVAPPLRPVLPPEAFGAFVRNPSGQMPPYSAKVLPDAELMAIQAYLRSLPPTKSASQIPLLEPSVRKPA
jgi:mono/diheme cytochrome c family protein